MTLEGVLDLPASADGQKHAPQRTTAGERFPEPAHLLPARRDRSSSSCPHIWRPTSPEPTKRNLREPEIGLGVQRPVLVFAGEKGCVGGGGDHRRIVGRKRAAWETNIEAPAFCSGCE
jgi:hypothetical protein